MEINELINKEDARIIRTKRDLANALEDLLKERSFNDISIKDITDKALISKNTFYNNFNDKNELLVFLFSRYEDSLIKETKPILEKTFFATKLFSFKKCVETIVHFFYTTNLPFNQIIKNDTSHILFYNLDIFIQDIFSKLESKYGKFLTKKINSKITSTFYAGAFASTIYFAYAKNLEIDEKTISKDLTKLSYHIVE
ncbi:MAG TPA: hypothetical protein DDW20_04210 [Firmicutes bacterium]|nr:hypothetical protein [Bacillota bacterium]